jgi:hypothetical protein
MCLGLSFEVKGKLRQKYIGLEVNHFFTCFYFYVQKLFLECFCCFFLRSLGLQNSKDQGKLTSTSYNGKMICCRFPTIPEQICNRFGTSLQASFMFKLGVATSLKQV